MLLSELIDSYRNKSGRSFSKISNIFERDEDLLNSLITRTSFLSNLAPINQRFYHVFFNEGEKICGCGKNLQFTGRFSPDKNKISANYLKTCGSPACLLDNLIITSKNNPNTIENYLYKIKNDPGLFKELCDRTYFLDQEYENIHPNQRFYHIWFNIYEIEKCPYCEKKRWFHPQNKFSTNRNKLNYSLATCGSEVCKRTHNREMTKRGVMKKYGVENISQTEQWRDSIKKTNQERYGADYQTMSKNFKEKKEKTNIEKYGVKHYTQTQEYLNKSNASCFKKYGVAYPTQNKEIMNKIQNTNINKYGTICPLNNEEIKKKTKDTCLLRYGATSHMQNAQFFETMKSKFMKFKIFEFPSGRIDKVQGYEPFALRELLNIGTCEEDIVIGDKKISDYIGKIFYHDLAGTRRRYYPDIYIISLNKIIEVKSTYTYTSSYEVNQLKKDATLSKGLCFEFWVYHPRLCKIEKVGINN